MAMLSFELDDKFLKDIDSFIKRTGRYSSRSEFLKESVRSNYEKMSEQEWKTKFRDETEKMLKLAYLRGYNGETLSKERLDEIGSKFIKKKGIKLI